MYKICTWYAIFAYKEVIIISTTGRKTFQMERFEYSSFVELDSISGNYFAIPSHIIFNSEMTEKRATIFSFFSIYRGLNCGLFFSVNNIVKWMGKQPNRNANGINNKIIQDIDHLKDEGYLTLSEELTNSSCIEAIFNLSKITNDCENDRFAIIYLDELKKILNYQCHNSKNAFFNNDIILLVFAYLRMKIYRRRNKLFPEEINIDNKNNHQHDIEVRRIRCPDAYDCYYNEIADELGLASRSVSKAVAALYELELIYYEPLPRIKFNNKWRTDHTIFCNAYKREGNCVLTSGKEYYLVEVKNKKKKLNIIDLKKGDA